MLSPAQKAYVRHLVVKTVDERDSAGEKDPEGKTKAGSSSCMTDQEFAAVIGVHYQTLRNWAKKPEVSAAFDAALREYETSKDYFKSCVRARAMEDLWTAYRSLPVKDPLRRHYHQMILNETKDAETSDEVVDFSDMSDDDLIAAVLSREVSVLGMTQRELALLVKGETCSKPLPEPSSEEPSSPEGSPPDGMPGTESPSHRVSQRRTSPKRRSKTRSA